MQAHPKTDSLELGKEVYCFHVERTANGCAVLVVPEDNSYVYVCDCPFTGECNCSEWEHLRELANYYCQKSLGESLTKHAYGRVKPSK